jgi:mono/diheme cytochrome c family protein
MAARGAGLYRESCQICHGAPGVAPAPFALGMTPAPVPLVHTARAWTPAEIFVVVKEGLKMTGMPAWRHRMTDDEIWAVVAFLPVMASVAPKDYDALPAIPPQASAEPFRGAPSAERGERALHQYACVTCHEIPRVVGANAPVGPPLGGVGARTMLGGVLPNSPENLVRWIREPQRYAPGSAMPDLGVSEGDAADIAAFLQTLR